MNIFSKTSKMKRRQWLTMASLTTLALTGAFTIPSADAQWYLRRPNNGNVYTQTNDPTPNGNSILGFRRDAFGGLTPLPTPSFPTGGAGIPNARILERFGVPVNTSLLSDKEIIVNPAGNRLFTVNTGSNTIAVFDINRDGSLSPVPGSPFPSGGVGPVSLGLAGDILYVLNQNIDAQNPSQEPTTSSPNYTAFRVTPRGNLISVPNSTVSVPRGSIPFQILVSPNERVLFGAEVLTGLLRSFQIQPNGRLLPSPNSPQQPPQTPNSPIPNIPLGIQVHPRQPILYVTFPVKNELGVYSYNRTTGELTFLKSVPNSGIIICWLAINRRGTRLYTTNPGDNSVSVYDIAKDPTTPVEIQKITLNNPPGIGGAQLTLDSTESFLHVVNQALMPDPPVPNNTLSVLRVNKYNGTLTEVPSSPRLIPSVNNSFPQGIYAD